MSDARSDPHRQFIQKDVAPILTNAPERTLPEDMRMPPGFHQRFKCPTVPCTRGFDLFTPKQSARLWQSEKMAIMSMPEASVYKNNRSVTGKHQVRSPWQSRPAQPISQSSGMQRMTNHQFNCCILSADSRHQSRTLIAGQDIHDVSSRFLHSFVISFLFETQMPHHQSRNFSDNGHNN